MLNPDSTVLLTEALQPPVGFHIDTAVATTYSLNLTAMLVAPMSFALGDIDDARALGSRDPVQMLDAVQRHISHTTVFCQAAAIHVPASHSRIHAFLDESIFQVEPSADNALFHPKLWAMRFARDSDGALHHRVIVASRNLTLDNSWDTALVLDEAPAGKIEAAPAADFVAELPALCTLPLPAERVEAIGELCSTLRDVRLEPPWPFTGGTLLPLGLSTNSIWPFTQKSERMLAISPFVTAGTLDRLRATTKKAELLSRPESLDQVGPSSIAGWDLHVLSSGTDLVDRSGSEATVIDEFTSTPAGATAHLRADELTGLHAKTIITDYGDGGSSVVTGSANLTSAAWQRNLEFDAVLTGPTETCGVEAVLGDGSGRTGLQMIMEPYSPKNDEPTDDATTAIGYQLENFHRELVSSDPRPSLDIIPRDDASVSARLTLTLWDELPGETEIWLSTVPGQRRPIAEVTSWDIAVENITPFIGVETRVDSGTSIVTRRCLIKVQIVGDPLARRQRALADILNSSERVLSYLALLLGIDDTPQQITSTEVELSTATTDTTVGTAAENTYAHPPIVLFEPLVRAVGTDVDQLASVAERIKELRDVPEVEARIPAEFLQMWDVVLAVVAESRRA